MASATVDVNGQVIPEGTGVEVPVWYLQHDPTVWDQPYEFDPERFSAENKPSINPMSYMPFGAGPRNCIGMRWDGFNKISAPVSRHIIVRQTGSLQVRLTRNQNLACSNSEALSAGSVRNERGETPNSVTSNNSLFKTIFSVLKPEIQLQQSTATINPKNGVFVKLYRR